MKRAECEKLIGDYLRWLKEELRVSELEDACRIATPFLDRHNDEVEIYAQKQKGGILLTDDGYTLSDLESCGMTFSTEKRNVLLTAILNGFGVKIVDDELQVLATPQDFPQKKHNLVQAMLAVNDMFVMAEPHVLSLFKDDVKSFLEQNSIPVFPDFKLSGRSGFDHKFDFGLPKTPRKPERLLQAINNLTKDQALSFAFAVADVRVIRAEQLQAYTFLNDVDHPPAEDNLGAIRAYQIEPILWSQRQVSILALNGG
ncbi:MAG: DUF1828 domain-containing protein [Planctomycetota bacterium]